jgi:hypothetical protein
VAAGEKHMNILETVQTNIIRKLKKARDASIFSVFTWSGLSFDSDNVSQTRILGLAVAAGAGAIPVGGIQWRLANNTWTTLYPSDVPFLFGALQFHIQSRFILFAQHEAIINSMTDPDLIVEYNVEVF